MWSIIVACACSYTFAQIVAGVVNWATWFPSTAEWELFQLAHPKWAERIRMLRAFGPHMRKVWPAFRRAAEEAEKESK